MALCFDKFHSNGNDFIIADNNNCHFEQSIGRIRLLCNRNIGIGADGLILCQNSDVADLRMQYYNSDGSGNTLCANGVRAAAVWGFRRWKLKNPVRIESTDGIHQVSVIVKADNEDLYEVAVSMNDIDQIIPYKEGFYLNTGSPHFVIPTIDTNQIDIEKEGRFWRFNERFAPHGTNVNFITTNNSEVMIRTYERGVETETLSCGSGVTAAAAVIALLQKQSSACYFFQTQGGRMSVSLKTDGVRYNEIILAGEVQFVFTGETNL